MAIQKEEKMATIEPVDVGCPGCGGSDYVFHEVEYDNANACIMNG